MSIKKKGRSCECLGRKGVLFLEGKCLPTRKPGKERASSRNFGSYWSYCWWMKPGQHRANQSKLRFSHYSQASLNTRWFYLFICDFFMGFLLVLAELKATPMCRIRKIPLNTIDHRFDLFWFAWLFSGSFESCQNSFFLSPSHFPAQPQGRANVEFREDERAMWILGFPTKSISLWNPRWRMMIIYPSNMFFPKHTRAHTLWQKLRHQVPKSWKKMFLCKCKPTAWEKEEPNKNLF